MSKTVISLVMGWMIFSGTSSAQDNKFPQSWIGKWKGELIWYKAGTKAPQKVSMELRIHPADSANSFTWQIIYGLLTKAGAEDNRPYTLVARDTAKGHWVIDENNGIVLDQFLIGNKFCGAFTVQNSMIVNNYWLEKGKLMAEFYSIAAKPIVTTGKGTEDIPFVDSYKMGSYQKAILTRIK